MPRALSAPVATAVLSGDPLAGESALSFLHGRPEVSVLTATTAAEADVLLVLASEVTEGTLHLMERFSARAGNPKLGIVLVAESMRRRQVVQALRYGLRTVLWRQGCDPARIVRTVGNVAAGRAELPPTVQGWLVDGLCAVEHEVLAPPRSPADGLAAREVEILRLLAEGLDTAEIAGRLNYSERTIKNIVSGLTSRLGLRNRAHAVAHALRTGILV